MRFSPCYRTLAPRGLDWRSRELANERSGRRPGEFSRASKRCVPPLRAAPRNPCLHGAGGRCVVPQDVPEGRLGAQQLAPHELEHQAPREPAIGNPINFYPADLGRAPVNNRSPAIASKRGPSRVAESIRRDSCCECQQARSAQGRQLERPSGVGAAGRSASQASSSSGIGAFHIILNIVVSASIRQPAGAAPDQPAQFLLFAGFAEGRDGRRSSAARSRRSQAVAETRAHAPHLASAAYDWRSPARQGTPDDVVLILADLHFDSPLETTAPVTATPQRRATSM